MLVEAAWAAARAPGPLRAFFLRVRAKRGQHVAAVATARKFAVLIWHLLHKKENYAWARPALQARKIRKLELKAGHPAKRGQKGSAHAHNIKDHREQERPKRGTTMKAARQGSHLTPCSLPRGHSCEKGKYRESKQKAQPMVDIVSGAGKFESVSTDERASCEGLFDLADS
jgi:hypothetical protein